MDYLAPIMYDVSNIDIWKCKMSAYLKTLRLHVYLYITKKSYVDNGKYMKANAHAMDTLKHTLCKEHLSLVFHCDSVFEVWNTLISHKEQASNISERESIRGEFDQTCYMVQGNNSLEVTLILI